MKRIQFSSLLITGMLITNSMIFAQENNYLVSKYDFILGEKVIFFDDFSSEGIGDFPAQWLTNGSGEIVTSEKFPGRWFHITKMGYFIPEAKEDFTENFTIEFDFIPMTTDKGETMYSFTFYLLTGSLGEPGGGGEPGEAGFQVYFDGENLGWKNWSMATEQRFNGNVTYPFKSNQNYHVAIWVQKQRIRLYANENKVLDVPRAVPSGSKPNIFRFDSRDEAVPLISNFRIAAGLPDMRNRLIKDGKIISYGIQFDVNSDKLKPESYSTLKEISDILKENPTMRLKISGHTDSDGDDASNLELSKRRSISVKNELINKFGVDGGRLETDGKGESEPVADNNSAVDKAKNRRVEFINMKDIPKAVVPVNSAANTGAGTFKDPRDGKTYKTIKIGKQIWMADNLAYKTDSGYMAYDKKENNLAIYGYLYTWRSANKACPSGWHLPSDDEWLILAAHFGDKELAAYKAKSNAGYSSYNITSKLKSSTHWEASDSTATNETGFTALPGGHHSDNNGFSDVGYYGEWWSSTPYSGSWSIDAAWSVSMFYSDSRVMRATNSKDWGLSVRCLKD